MTVLPKGNLGHQPWSTPWVATDGSFGFLVAIRAAVHPGPSMCQAGPGPGQPNQTHPGFGVRSVGKCQEETQGGWQWGVSRSSLQGGKGDIASHLCAEGGSAEGPGLGMTTYGLGGLVASSRTMKSDKYQIGHK